MNNNDFIKKFRNQDTITRKEIKEFGFSDYKIKKLVEKDILKKEKLGVYKLVSKNEAKDYIKIASSYTSILQFDLAEKYFNKAEDLEKNYYLYFKKIYFYLLQDDYKSCKDMILKIISLDEHEEIKDRTYVILMLLSQLINIDEDLIKSFKIDTFINRQTDDYILYEYYISAVRSIENKNFGSAKAKIDYIYKSTNNKTKVYIYSLVRLFLNKILLQEFQQVDSFTIEGKRLYYNQIDNLYSLFKEAINLQDYNLALKIIKKIKALQIQINPISKDIDNYDVYITLLEEINNLEDNQISTRNYYDIDERYFYKSFVFKRLIEEHDFKSALLFNKTIDRNYQEFYNIANMLLAKIDSLNNSYKQPDEALNNLLKSYDYDKIIDYLKSQKLKTIDLFKKYLELAKYYYKSGLIEEGDYFYNLVDPNYFKAIKYYGPLNQEKILLKKIRNLHLDKQE